MTLKNRCIQFMHDAQSSAQVEIDDLVDFVRSEIGRAADEALESSEPLVLYFAEDKDRKEFVDVILSAKPSMISRQWPR